MYFMEIREFRKESVSEVTCRQVIKEGRNVRFWHGRKMI